MYTQCLDETARRTVHGCLGPAMLRAGSACLLAGSAITQHASNRGSKRSRSENFYDSRQRVWRISFGRDISKAQRLQNGVDRRDDFYTRKPANAAVRR